MKQALWWWFLLLYVLGIGGLTRSVLQFRRERSRIEKQAGSFPPKLALVAWLVPPLILISHVGELSKEWPAVRALGLILSLYALFMAQGAVRALGRLLVPGRGIYQDHSLVTSGPYRWVRHPLYSAAFALWLGAALATLNWLLLVLWPLVVMAVLREMREEEEMLRAKFGAAYEAYAARTGRVIPAFRGPGRASG